METVEAGLPAWKVGGIKGGGGGADGGVDGGCDGGEGGGGEGGEPGAGGGAPMGQLDSRYGGGPGLNSNLHAMLTPKSSWALWPERWTPIRGGGDAGGDPGGGDAVAKTKPARRSTVCARMPEVVLVARLLVTVRRGAGTHAGKSGAGFAFVGCN